SVLFDGHPVVMSGGQVGLGTLSAPGPGDGKAIAHLITLKATALATALPAGVGTARAGVVDPGGNPVSQAGSVDVSVAPRPGDGCGCSGAPGGMTLLAAFGLAAIRRRRGFP